MTLIYLNITERETNDFLVDLGSDSESDFNKTVNYSMHDILLNGTTMNNLPEIPTKFFEGIKYSSLSNSSSLQLPQEYTEISPAAMGWIIAYCIVLVLASVGNLLEFFVVWRRITIRRTPMNMLLMNLCIADILVVVFVVAVEIGWRVSIGWHAGRFMCKFVQFCRAFSLYLSSFVLSCLTLDRYYAVLHPLKVVSAYKRVKFLLIMAWTLAAVFASPQCVVFDVKSHPIYTTFTQCTTEGDFAEEANTILSICFMYFLPFLLILFSYGSIIFKLTAENKFSTSSIRRSNQRLMDRAKTRALKLTFTIILMFICCWTPYIVMTTWHIVDRASAEKVSNNTQQLLFIMVVANSCVNPLVYGVFHSGTRKQGQVRKSFNGSCPTPSASAAFTMSIHSRNFTLRKHCPSKVEMRLADQEDERNLEHSSLVQVHSVCINEEENSRFGSKNFLSKPQNIMLPVITNRVFNVSTFIDDMGEGKIETTSV